jgi:rod shape-determining protein MreC
LKHARRYHKYWIFSLFFRRKHRYFVSASLILTLFFLLSEFLHAPYMGPLKRFIIDTSQPVIVLFSNMYTKIEQTGQTLYDHVTAYDRLKKLEKKYRTLYHTRLKTYELKLQNKRLKKLLNYTDQAHTVQTAQIIKFTGYIQSPALLINVGAQHHVRENQAVTYGNALIGRIIELYDQYAHVLPVTDINSRVPVYLPRTKQQAILFGQNNHTPALFYVQPQDIKKGDLVVTSGQGGIFPPGLLVGQVKEVTPHPIVSLFAPMQNLDYVQVHQIDPNS